MWIAGRTGTLVACALLVASRASRAQDPGARAALDSIRASFASIADSSALLARERERIGYAREHRDDPMIHFELGFLAFRLSELNGGSKHFDDAASELEWAAELRPGWPYAWYWLGMTELSIGETRNIPLANIRQVLGVDPLSKAVRAFARALEADPAFSAALVDLATTALRQRIAPRLGVAQRALREASGTPAGRIPAVLLVRGRVERQLGEFDSALAAFHAYLAVGGDPGVGGIEIARALAALGRSDSAQAAYARAGRGPVSDPARGEFRRDVRWIASPEELTAFGALPADSVGGWVGRFWARRDVADGRRAGERLLEQFRRYQYARARYLLVSRHRSADVANAYRDTTQAEFDDRGVIYLRHGEPDGRAQYADGVVEPNESWLYRRPAPEPDLIFHFVARGDVQDFRLVESILDIYGFSTTVAYQTRENLPTTAIAGLVNSRAALSPVYEQMSHLSSVSRGPLIAQERAEGRRAVNVGVHTDSYAMRFEHDLRPVVSSFAVAGAPPDAELHVIFAVPVSRLHAAATEAGATAYPLSLRLVVYDSSMSEVAALDTLRVFRSAQPLPEGSYLTEQVTVRVPPGSYRYHFVVAEPQADAGALVRARAVEVPRVGGVFTASDLVMGREGSGLVWRRPEGEVPLNPLQRFPRDGEATLYYELYGLPQGASVGTRVIVSSRGGRSIFRRIFGGGGGADLAYTTVTDAAQRVRIQQRLALAGLPPGRYTLTLELEDPVSGRRVVRRQPFEIGSARAP
jgi:GWxTD domain-containing protein